MTGDRDLVQRYLDELALRLQGPAAHVRRVFAETEAHLYDASDAQLSAGGDLQAAQAEAVRRFGSPTEVAAAVNAAAWARARGPVLRAAGATLTRLAAAGLLTMGATGMVARIIAALTSTKTVYGLPAGARLPASSCRYWLATGTPVEARVVSGVATPDSPCPRTSRRCSSTCAAAAAESVVWAITCGPGP